MLKESQPGPRLPHIKFNRVYMRAWPGASKIFSTLINLFDVVVQAILSQTASLTDESKYRVTGFENWSRL